MAKSAYLWKFRMLNLLLSFLVIIELVEEPLVIQTEVGNFDRTTVPHPFLAPRIPFKSAICNQKSEIEHPHPTKHIQEYTVHAFGAIDCNFVIRCNAQDINVLKMTHSNSSIPDSDRAAILLKSSTLTVSEIIDQTGFTSRTHFYDLFGKTYGCSPLEYRGRGEFCILNYYRGRKL